MDAQTSLLYHMGLGDPPHTYLQFYYSPLFSHLWEENNTRGARKKAGPQSLEEPLVLDPREVSRL
jgi:hypothetical protein